MPFESLADHAHFSEVLAASNVLPAAPRFIFGAMPAAVAAVYFAQSALAATGLYTAKWVTLGDGFLLGAEGRILEAPQLNMPRVYVDQAIRKFGQPSAGTLPPRRLAGPHALIAGPGYGIYGHWLSDMLPRLAVLASAGVDLGSLRLLVPADMPPFAAAMLDLLGFGEDRRVRFGGGTGSVLIEELLLPNFLHNSVRYSPILRQAATLFRERVEARHGRLALARYPRRILIARRGTSRALAERQAMEAECVLAGFTRVVPETLPLLDQWRMFADAREIVGEYGSALHASLFSAPGTVVCALRGSREHPAFIQSGFGDVLAQPTGYIFGETFDSADEPFSVRMEDVKACLGAVFRAATVRGTGWRSAAGIPDVVDTVPGVAAAASGQALIIDFSKWGNSAAYCVSGWSTQEETHTWTLDEASVLALPLRDASRDLCVEIDVGAGLFPPAVAAQSLRVEANGHPIGSFLVTGRETIALQIPRELLRSSSGIELRFVHPDCVSPRSMGINDDDRRVAISFFRVTISPVAGEETRRQ